MFIADQYSYDFNDAFVWAAMLEVMRSLKGDFFALDDYHDFHTSMCAYLNK